METHTSSSRDLVFVQRARHALQYRKLLLPELIVRVGHVPAGMEGERSKVVLNLEKNRLSGKQSSGSS